VSVVFNEAEAARSLLETIEAHDETFDFADFGEKLVDLLFGGVERPSSQSEERYHLLEWNEILTSCQRKG